MRDNENHQNAHASHTKQHHSKQINTKEMKKNTEVNNNALFSGLDK